MTALAGCGEKSEAPKPAAQEQGTAKPAVVESRFAIGGYTDGPGQGVNGLSLNHATGELTSLGLLAETVNPSYVVFNEDATVMYTVNEKEHGGISAFTLNTTNKTFTLTAATQGVAYAPCHISLSPNGKFIAVANYMSGDVQLFSRAADANLALVSAQQHTGKGPNESRQEAPHPHWINWSPDGKFVYSVDLGIDQIIKYTVTEQGFSAGEPAITLQGGDGPRHMVFHANKDIAYVVNELSNTVAVLSYNPDTGALTEMQRIGTLDPAFSEHSQTAAIKISPDQRFVYASNRGANTIAVFAVAADGRLTYVHEHATEGKWPRDFTLTSDGKYVLVANEHSSTITLLARDSETGKLSSTGKSIATHRPTAVVEF